MQRTELAVPGGSAESKCTFWSVGRGACKQAGLVVLSKMQHVLPCARLGWTLRPLLCFQLTHRALAALLVDATLLPLLVYWFVRNLDLAVAFFDRDDQILEAGEKSLKQTQNKSTTKSNVLILTIRLNLHWSWFGDPGNLPLLFTFSVCSSKQVLFVRVPVKSTFAAVLQTYYCRIEDRDIFWDSNTVSSLLSSCSVSFSLLFGPFPSLQILVTLYQTIFAQEITSIEGIRSSCCCGLPFPLLQHVNNSPRIEAAQKLRQQNGVPGFNPVAQCIVI